MDSKRRVDCTFLWFIQNYRYCWHDNGDILESPEITPDGLEGTSWKLQLFPRGKDDYSIGNISFYLCRSEHDDGPEDFLLKFELSFITANGSPLKSEKVEFKFKKGNRRGIGRFLDIEEVFLQRKAEYLIKDTLSVCCKMWKDERTIQKISHYSARTFIGIENIDFVHELGIFGAFEQKEKKTLQIKSRANLGCVISSSLDLVRKSNDEITLDITARTSLHAFLCGYSLCKQKLFFRDKSGNTFEYGKGDYRFDAMRNEFNTLHLSLTRQLILKKRNNFLLNDEMSLVSVCTFSTGLKLEEINKTERAIFWAEYQHGYFNSHSLNVNKAAEKLSVCSNALEDKKTINSNQCIINEELSTKTIPGEITNHDLHKNVFNIAIKLSSYPSVVDDFKAIYDHQVFSDVELKTATKSFHAHKIVLCARSYVFKAMLTNDMKEKNTDSIPMDDFENDTVHQLLLFLYSDELENLNWESAIKLYYAGDKYAIGKLKVLCSSFLVDNLNISTASELLLLADTHSDLDLKSLVEDFILEHEEEVFGSDEWEKLIETNPQLVIKTMHLKYKRKKGVK